MISSRTSHAAKVDRVRKQLRAHDGSRPVSLLKRAVSHQVPKRNDLRRSDDKIDLTDLDEILEIDPDGETCTAEPGVTFVDLVRACARYGLAPIIVPELRTITIGGAVSGCSIESMSFTHGGFHDTCLEYEVITATGDVITCSPRDHSLLFQMMHGSFGTLGILSKLRFRLIRIQPFVHVTHERYRTVEQYQRAIWEHYREQDVDFIDGFVHGPDSFVLCAGRFSDWAPYTNRYDWTKVYWQSTLTRHEDYLKASDYYFRYDNGVTNVHPKSAIGRLLFGKIAHSAQILRLADKLHMLLSDRPDVTVDLFLPFSKVPQLLDWWTESFGFFPLWVVPYKRVHDYEWISPSFWSKTTDPLFVDLAIYGMKQPEDRNAYVEIEAALERIGGIKTLISYNYYDEDTFWTIFDKERYDAIKRITDPSNLFRDLYAKTCRAPLGLAS